MSSAALNLAETASRARVLRFPSQGGPPANALGHLPPLVAELRAEVRRLQAEVESLRHAAKLRAEREERLAAVTVTEIDGTAAFRAKLAARHCAFSGPRIILTLNTATVLD